MAKRIYGDAIAPFELKHMIYPFPLTMVHSCFATVRRACRYDNLFCCSVNTLRPKPNGPYFPDGIFKCIYMNENVWLAEVPKGPINNIPALVQIMAWRRPGDRPLSEPMMVSLLTQICVTRPQCVKVEHLVRNMKIWRVITLCVKYFSRHSRHWFKASSIGDAFINWRMRFW